uniref:CCHC-type domain-containing protein n=1 Tax=Nippostrongylus brasiliensis TaxID=27835 RepID=A0A0N4YD51_NIPBR
MTGGRGTGLGCEEVSVPNVMSALSHRIDRFTFNPDNEVDMGFSRWFSRYEEVLMNDAKLLPESARVWLLCEKLDTVSFEKYQRHVLPRKLSEIGFDETVQQLFDLKSSEFTTKYQCLNSEMSDSEDYLTYMEKAGIHEVDSDGIKCLLWIFGLKSQEEAEVRQRLIAVLDREYQEGRKVSLQQLHKECEKFLSLKRDSDTIAGNVRFVKEARKAGKKVVCWNCEKNRSAKVGHKEKYCEDARRGSDRRSNSTERRRDSKDRKRKTRPGAKRHVQVIRIANAAM